jgi:methanogenic corrinoid protein MtbC1
MTRSKDSVEEFERALLTIDRARASDILELLNEGMSPIEVVEQTIVPALEWIGDAWESGDVALSQVYMSGRICEELVDTFLPPADEKRKRQPVTAIAALEDHHALGKRIVYSSLRASGYELTDYGHGITADKLVERSVADGIEVLLVSTLMLRSALKVEALAAGLKKAGSGARIIVGGAPFLFDERLWREVGASAMGRDASDAMRLMTELNGAL